MRYYIQRWRDCFTGSRTEGRQDGPSEILLKTASKVNMTSDGSNTYTWDSRQRLSTLTGTTSGSFIYDAANRRSQKTIAGQTTGYVYDGVNLVQELTGTVTPTVQANLLTGDVDEVFSRTEASGSTYSYLVDALGSTQALTDSTGAFTTQYTYAPYGQTSSSGSASTNSQQYTGRENDGTGLYYYRARYYSPGFGRFISGDPIGLAGGINTYGYVGENPTSRIDPLGLDWVYQQSTGNIYHTGNNASATTKVGTGYAENGEGRNNSAMEGVTDVGPIPQGTYDIGPGHYSPNTGPNTMNLTPQQGTDTLGRDLFRIHGDNATNNASHGCIVANPQIRNQINNSSDQILRVVP